MYDAEILYILKINGDKLGCLECALLFIYNNSKSLKSKLVFFYTLWKWQQQIKNLSFR